MLSHRGNACKALVNPTGHWIKKEGKRVCCNCEISIWDHVSRINLNVFPLGAYDMIIGMGWLARYKVVLNLFDKTFTDVA